MVNIGEISKPSVSVEPVKPRRSESDSELVTAADTVGSTVKISTQIYPKKQKPNKKTTQQTAAEELETSDDLESKTSIDDISYDETGHQTHHGNIDIKA